MESQAAKLPLFSGDAKDFQLWWMHFQAFATATGFKQAIGQKKDKRMPSDNDEVINQTTVAGKE